MTYIYYKLRFEIVYLMNFHIINISTLTLGPKEFGKKWVYFLLFNTIIDFK